MTDFATLGVTFASRGGNLLLTELERIRVSGGQTEQQITSLVRATNALKRLFALGALGIGVNTYLEMADKVQALNAQLKFVTQSQSQFNVAQKALFSIAQNTRASLESTTQLYIKSSQALKDYGYAQKDILKFTETINKAMAVGGVDAQSQASALLQLSQALGSGQLQGDEFKTIAESAPIILDVLAEYMGKSRAEVKKLASDGKITAELLFNAFNQSSDKINAKFQEMPLTFGGAMQQLQNAVLQFIGSFDSASGISSVLAQGISFVAEHFSILAKAIGYATTAYVVYNTVSFASNFKQASNGIGILATSFGYLAQSVRTATAAMLANPLLLLVSAVAATAFAFDAFLSDMVVGASQVEATWGDVAKGVWSDFKDVLGQTADWVTEKWKEATEEIGINWNDLGNVFANVGVFIVDSIKQHINNVIAIFVAGYHVITIAWQDLPHAFSSIGKTAINGLVKIIESGLNYLIKGIQSFLNLFNTASNAVGLGNLFGTSEWKIELPKVELNKAETQIKEKLGDAVKSAFSTDYVGNTIDNTINYLVDAGDRYKKSQQRKENEVATKRNLATPEGDKKKGRKGHKEKKDKTTDYLKEWQQYYSELERANADSWTKIALEEARSRNDMLEKAKKANASAEQIEKAKTLIVERYAKERRAIAEKYAPELAHQRQLKEQLAEIQSAEKGGFLTKKQAQQARERVKWNSGEQIAKQAGENAVSGYDKFIAQFDPAQAEINNYKSKQAELQSYYDQNLIAFEEFNRRKQQIEEQYRSTLLLQDLANYSQGLQSLGNAFGQMADLAGQAMGKQSSVYKTMFGMAKAFAIADSMLKLQQAIVQAMADGSAMTPAQKFANMAAVASAGMNVISQITSANMSGMAHSGIDNIPKEGTWLLDKGERVVDSRTNQDLKTFLANTKQGGQSGKSTINVKIINNGQPVNAEVKQEETADGTQITVALLSKMESIANGVYTKRQQQDLRSGGVLARY